MMSANLLIGRGDAGGVKVLADLAEDVVLAGLLEVRHDNLFRIGPRRRGPLRSDFSAAQSPK